MTASAQLQEVAPQILSREEENKREYAQINRVIRNTPFESLHLRFPELRRLQELNDELEALR